MRGRFKRFLLACLLSFPGLCLIGAEAGGLEAGTFSALKNPRPAVDFSLKDLSGASRRLSDFRGKTVLLHFWASWCEPCKAEYPALKRLWDELGGKDFVILAVAEDSAERVRPFVQERGVGFPVLIDQYGGVMRSYGVSVIPVSFVIDKDGMIEAALVGPGDYGSTEAKRFLSHTSR